MRNGHEVACENIKKIISLLETDQIFKLTVTGLDDGQTEELLLFFADSIGTLYKAFEEMYEDHKNELE